MKPGALVIFQHAVLIAEMAGVKPQSATMQSGVAAQYFDVAAGFLCCSIVVQFGDEILIRK